MSRQSAEARVMDGGFSTSELDEIERSSPDGLSAQSIVDILAAHGITLVASTFRKYVQLGLLPRSRRVGRKGKHQGSHGLYPASVVARVIEIRRLMDDGLTLDEIQRSSVTLRSELDAVRGLSESVLEKLENEATRRAPERAELFGARVSELRRQALALVVAIETAAEELCPPKGSVVESAVRLENRMAVRQRTRAGRGRVKATEGLR